LPLADPDAAQARSRPGLDAEVVEDPDEDRLQHADVPAHVHPVVAQVEDRIADELAGAVVRDLAAAADAHDRDLAARGPEVPEVAGIGAAPQRVRRRVLEKQKDVRATGEPARDELLLQCERIAVLDRAEQPDLEAGAHTFTAWPAATSTASRNASAIVGCAWT